VTFDELSEDNSHIWYDSYWFDYSNNFHSIMITLISLSFNIVSVLIVSAKKSLRRNMHGTLLICLLSTMILSALHTIFFYLFYWLLIPPYRALSFRVDVDDK
jgi:NADH:ubiquinone oxidoreductase subunit 4 (subunit M)